MPVSCDLYVQQISCHPVATHVVETFKHSTPQSQLHNHTWPIQLEKNTQSQPIMVWTLAPFELNSSLYRHQQVPIKWVDSPFIHCIFCSVQMQAWLHACARDRGKDDGSLKDGQGWSVILASIHEYDNTAQSQHLLPAQVIFCQTNK